MSNEKDKQSEVEKANEKPRKELEKTKEENDTLRKENKDLKDIFTNIVDITSEIEKEIRNAESRSIDDIGEKW